MAVWSAQGFLFLSGSRSCARSRLHRPQPQEHTGASSAAGTSRHAQVGGKGTPLRGWGGGHSPVLLWGFSLCGDILPCMEPGSSTLLLLAVPSLMGCAPWGQAWAEFSSCWPCHSSGAQCPVPPLAGLLPVPWPLGAVLPQCAQLPPARAQGVGQDRTRAAGAPWGRCSRPHGTRQSGAGF